MRSLDLNCDMAELPELAANGVQDALLALVSSVSLACGAHAGDASLLRGTMRAAAGRGVRIGAHPGYPDRQQFGRLPIDMGQDALLESLRRQLRVAAEAAAECGVPLRYVKPHGALYNQVARDAALAGLLAQAMQDELPGLPVMMLAGCATAGLFHQAGIPMIAEAFADRRYEADGSLRNRALPGAVVSHPDEAARQAVSIARYHVAHTVNGHPAPIVADTLCVHSDTPGAVALARAVRQALEAEGFRVAAATAWPAARSSAP
jgi:UPF0271 protein